MKTSLRFCPTVPTDAQIGDCWNVNGELYIRVYDNSPAGNHLILDISADPRFKDGIDEKHVRGLTATGPGLPAGFAIEDGQITIPAEMTVK